jgi:hypothetical protein
MAIVLFTMMSGDPEADPKTTAKQFLTFIQKGDYKGTVDMFGGNTCRCPKKGGWVSYLVYASAQEPNLAFLMGRPFKYSNMQQTAIKHPDKNAVTILPWQKPEDVIVDVDLTLNESRYAPMFLPLNMAYGIPMDESEFKAFIEDPDKDSRKGFALRLRPSIAPGAIERPEASKGIEYKPTEKANEVNRSESLSIEDKRKLLVVESNGKQLPISEIKKIGKLESRATGENDEKAGSSLKQMSQVLASDKNETGAEEENDDSFIYASVEDAIKETLGEEVARYLHPRDAGPVKLSSGKNMSPIEIEKQLPRLTSAKLRLHIVRREKLRRWTVYHMSILEPILTRADGSQCALPNYKPPSGEAVPDPKESAEN